MKVFCLRGFGAVLAASVAHGCWGLGLGAAVLYSSLNEPLSAELFLLETEGLDAADVRLGLASAGEFERLGVDRGQFLSQLVFDVQFGASGARVLLTSEKPVREPYLNFVVEARWPEGRLLREYTLLLDLPTVATEMSALPPSLLLSPDAPEADAPPTISANAIDNEIRPGGTYLVRNSDTLWRIASAAKPEGITMEQAMLSIVYANSEAFERGNINGLKSGYMLSLPTAGEVAISSVEARDEVARQNAEWSAPAPLETPGLKLVADPVAVADETLPKATVETAVSSVALEEEARAAAVSDDRSPVVPDTTVSPEFSALLSKVEALESNLRRMEEQLVQRDLELEALRVQLLAATEKLKAPVVASSPTGEGGSTERSLLWLSMGALGLVMSGGAAIWWWRRGRLSSPAGGSYTAQPSAQLREEVESTQAVAAAPGNYPVYSQTSLPEDPVVGDAESTSTDHDRSTAHESSETALSGAHPDPLPQGEPTEPVVIESAAGHGQAESGLSLVPVPHDAETDSGTDARGIDAPAAEESIYGLETDPIDSKLDLARAYLDMGDEEGARAVLAEVIKEGNLSQQAEARELLSRFEVS